MKLSLARWEDADGCSRGHWLIRQLPGFRLLDGPGGWRIGCFPASPASSKTGPFLVDAIGVWGGGWRPRRDLYDSLPRAAKGPHPTRASALLALEACLSEAPSPVLGGIL